MRDTEDVREETLDTLTQAMTEFYESRPKRHHKFSVHGTELVAVKAAPVGDSKKAVAWYRARVIETDFSGNLDELGLEGGSIVVHYVDHGGMDSVTLLDIREMQPRFLNLPLQAIECELAGAKPRDGGKKWSAEAVERFRELVAGKELLGEVKAQVSGDVLAIELYQEDEAAAVAKTMEREGLVALTDEYLNEPAKVEKSGEEVIILPG